MNFAVIFVGCSEAQLAANLEETVRQLVLVRELTSEDEQPAIQTKFTAHMDVNLLVNSANCRLLVMLVITGT